MTDDDVAMKKQDFELATSCTTYSNVKEELESLGIFIDKLPSSPSDDQTAMIQILTEEIERLKEAIEKQEIRIGELEKLAQYKHEQVKLDHYQ